MNKVLQTKRKETRNKITIQPKLTISYVAGSPTQPTWDGEKKGGADGADRPWAGADVWAAVAHGAGLCSADPHGAKGEGNGGAAVASTATAGQRALIIRLLQPADVNERKHAYPTGERLHSSQQSVRTHPLTHPAARPPGQRHRVSQHHGHCHTMVYHTITESDVTHAYLENDQTPSSLITGVHHTTRARPGGGQKVKCA